MANPARMIVSSAAAAALVVLLGAAPAEAFNVDEVRNSCKSEFTSLCKDVVPGQGRLLTCLYTFEDRISDKCAAAVHNGAEILEQVFEAITQFTTQCQDDVRRFCPEVKPGKGRREACLTVNEKALSQNCRAALVRTP